MSYFQQERFLSLCQNICHFSSVTLVFWVFRTLADFDLLERLHILPLQFHIHEHWVPTFSRM